VGQPLLAEAGGVGLGAVGHGGAGLSGRCGQEKVNKISSVFARRPVLFLRTAAHAC